MYVGNRTKKGLVSLYTALEAEFQSEGRVFTTVGDLENTPTLHWVSSKVSSRDVTNRSGVGMSSWTASDNFHPSTPRRRRRC